MMAMMAVSNNTKLDVKVSGARPQWKGTYIRDATAKASKRLATRTALTP